MYIILLQTCVNNITAHTEKAYENFIYLQNELSMAANCNTPGVCHPLSNGFKLNHDMFSGDEDVKVKPMEMSPNLNSDIAPLLYI